MLAALPEASVDGLVWWPGLGEDGWVSKQEGGPCDVRLHCSGKGLADLEEEMGTSWFLCIPSLWLLSLTQRKDGGGSGLSDCCPHQMSLPSFWACLLGGFVEMGGRGLQLIWKMNSCALNGSLGGCAAHGRALMCWCIIGANHLKCAPLLELLMRAT